jgi:DNA mismatch repair protein MutS
MAGLPEEVTERAKKILRNLEESELSVYSSGKQLKGRIPPPDIQMTLFEMKDDRLREDIRKLDVENMTPMEALQQLADLKKRTEQK